MKTPAFRILMHWPFPGMLDKNARDFGYRRRPAVSSRRQQLVLTRVAISTIPQFFAFDYCDNILSTTY